MDNVTHTLFAVTLARTPLGRAGRGTTAALILGSNAPDIDIVATAAGAVSYLEWHRGPTHGPFGILVLGLLTAGFVGGGRLLIDRRPRKIRPGLALASQPPGDSTASARQDRASFGKLAVVSSFGVLFHLLMDLPTSYGTRLLSPFDWHWYAIDWMPIIDLYLLAVLAGGLVLVRSAPARRRNAAIVLALMAANYGLRAAAHERAIAVAPMVFGPLLPERCEGTPPQGVLDRWPRPATSGDRCLIEIAATPGFSSPFEWRLIAQLTNGYYVRSINLLNLDATDIDPRAVRPIPNVWTPAVFRAAHTRPARVFLGFSRFPAVRVSVDHGGVATIQWADMRFSGGPDPPRPQNDGRGDLFGTRVRVAPDGHVLDARIGGR